MTIFNVSLFLPYTVNFHLPHGQPQSRASSPSGRADPPNASASDLYKKGSFTRKKGHSISRPSTSASSSASHSTRATPSSSRRPSDTTDPDEPGSNAFLAPPAAAPATHPRLVPSEFDLAEWGSQGPYVQPPPHTAPAPSASILGDAAVLSDAPVRAAAGDAGPPRPEFAYADWTIEPSQCGNGGLKNAVSASGAAGQVWVGTLGMPTDALGAGVKAEIAARLAGEHAALTVYVDDCDFDGHYLRFCKTILWPVFHYQIPDNPKSKAYEDHSWIYYERVCRAFADTVARHWRPGDVVWVHDYHLLLVPAMLRARLPAAQIGFFLHVAFPSSEVFRCLAVRTQVLQGMLGAHLVGFQSAEYCHHFLQTCVALLNAEAVDGGVQLENRHVQVGTFPIGIDPVSLEARRRADDVREFIVELRRKYAGKRLIVARDKLDNIRGVRQKLLAYELFLNKYPRWRGQVVLLQVALTTAEQPELEAVVTDIASRINSAHSSLSHQPLVFLRQDISFAQFLALISVADLLMVTSLREGMNLTSHEFIYCQDGALSPATKHAPLILSEFTGSAALFRPAAFLVNPWNYHAVAAAIDSALALPARERTARWLTLHAAVTARTAAAWSAALAAALAAAHARHAARANPAIPRLDVARLAAAYARAQRRLLVLDYEGTLAAWGAAAAVRGTPQRALAALDALLEEAPRTAVCVVGARRAAEMARVWRRVPGAWLVAEGGCFVREGGGEAWEALVSEARTREWMGGVRGVVEYFRARTEGSWVEEREASVVFRYANCGGEAARHGAECAANINETCRALGVHAVNADGAMVVAPVSPNKATAAELVYERLCRESGEPVDFLMVAGDGREDEVMFKWANRLGEEGKVAFVETVKLGLQNSEAKSTMVQGVSGLLSCLEKLATVKSTVDEPAR